jgi:hypothetical protein
VNTAIPRLPDQEATLKAEVEYDPCSKPFVLKLDDIILPIQAEVLDSSGLGYL